MKTIKEISSGIQNNGESIIVVNPDFVLSKYEKNLHIRSLNGNHLVYETNSYFRIDHVSERFLKIEWSTKSTTKRYLDTSIDQNIQNILYFDFKNRFILYCKSDDRSVFIFNRIKTVIQYDFKLEKLDSYLGWVALSDDKSDIKRNYVISLNDDTNYEIFSNDQKDYITNILYNEGNTLHVISIKNGYLTKKTIYSIENIKKWYRLSRIEGFYTLLFDFYVIETYETTVLFNLKTLKSVELSFQVILPTSFEFCTDYYLNKHLSKSLINLYTQYVCVDNKIYDENLNVVLEYKPRPKSKITLLDTYGNYIAYMFNNEIRIVLASPTFDGFESKEAKYVCCENIFENEIAIKVIDFIRTTKFNHIISSNDLIMFNPKTHKFIIDVKQIEEEDRYRRKHAISTPEHYSIWDALDGDAEAYWNID